MGIMRMVSDCGLTGTPAENCGKRCARMKLVWNFGPSGSRRQPTPAILAPVRGNSESSTARQMGWESGISAAAWRRTPANRESASMRSWEKSR